MQMQGTPRLGRPAAQFVSFARSNCRSFSYGSCPQVTAPASAGIRATKLMPAGYASFHISSHRGVHRAILAISGVKTPESSEPFAAVEQAAEKSLTLFPQRLKPSDSQGLNVGVKAPTPKPPSISASRALPGAVCEMTANHGRVPASKNTSGACQLMAISLLAYEAWSST